MPKPTKSRPDDVHSLLAQQSFWNARCHPVWVQIIQEMLLLYYPPFHAETEEELLSQTVMALRGYLVDLQDFPTEILSQGWQDVRRKHKVARWPAIYDILTACEAAADGKAWHAAKKNAAGKEITQTRAREERRVREQFSWHETNEIVEALLMYTDLPVIKIRAWFREARLRGEKVIFPSRSTKAWVENNYANDLEKALGFRPEIRASA